MNKAAVMLVPAALFAAAIWAIVWGIDQQVSRENNNRIHAQLLSCVYAGRSDKMEGMLYFVCDNKIELHKEIDWTLTQ
jgi:hypothetical protein